MRSWNNIRPALFAFSFIFLAGWFFVAPESVFAGTSNICSDSAESTPVPCGRNCDNPETANDETAVCSLCHFFLLMKNLSDWILRIMTIIALVILVAMGLLYVVSIQNGRFIGLAKKGMRTALSGFAITLLGWVVVNTVLLVFADGALGSETATFSIKESRTGRWFQFNCNLSGSGSTTDPGTGDQSPSTNVCSLYTASTAIPAGYGSPFNQLSGSKSSLLSVSCSDAGATATAGSSQGNTYVYQSGFVSQNNTWSQVSFSGTAAENNAGWLSGTATASLPAASSSQSFVTAFVCQYTDGKWKCGCRDNACDQNYWTIQAYKK